MNFNSLQYLIFLPCAVILYFLMPLKWRNGLLLGLSYFFYMCWKAQYALLMLLSTLITYVCALLMEKRFLNHRKLWLALSLVINLLILFFFKYFNFLFGIIGNVFAGAGLGVDMPLLDILLPVGISFYTFQALGYTIDVYRNDIKAERSFVDYALFVSFFPQLVAGPIERSTNLLPQFKVKHTFDINNLFEGALLFLWGIFKKIVIADNLAVIVNYAFDASPESVTGMQYAVAAVAFSIQIYCDFSAYSDIARGSARIMGFSLMRNFDAPYLAVSIKDFWRRWHISLSTWFKDYLYFPLGGSRRRKARVYLNLMIIFLVSGLWHGAAVTFVIWGALHGFYSVMSLITKPLRAWILRKIGISEENRVLNVFRGLFTFALVTLTFIFFRAQSVLQALRIIKAIALTPLSGNFRLGLSAFPLGMEQMRAVLCAVLICFIVDYVLTKKKITVALKPVARYVIYFALITATIIFGSYGSGYNPQEFIYFQF